MLLRILAGFARTKPGFTGVFRKHLSLLLMIGLPTAIFFGLLSYIEFSPDTAARAGKVRDVTMILLATWLAVKIVEILNEAVLNRIRLDKPDNLQERKMATQIRYVKTAAVLLIITVGAALILMSFDSARRVGAGILASAGIIGVALAFAAQKVLGNVLAGFQIAFTQPIRIDDVVIVEGEWGRIEEITMTYVVVRIWDQRRLVLPITYFIETPFQNWTRTSADILGTVFLYTDYTVNVDEIRGELDRILSETELWDGQVKNVLVTNATEKTMELRALMSAKDASTAWALRCHVREKLIKYMQENHPQSLPKARIEVGK